MKHKLNKIMIIIPLEEFVLQVPQIDKLQIQPIGSSRIDENLGLVQDVYYTLNRKGDGKEFERGNKAIPKSIYNLIDKYITGEVTATDIATLNGFFVLADWPLVAVLPVTPEVEPEI